MSITNSKIQLSDTTLVCIDCVDANRAARAIAKTMSMFEFGKVIFFTDKSFSMNGVDVIKIPSITSKTEYSKFMIRDLVDYIDTYWIMTVQWDGFPINMDAFTHDYFSYDYIGAPWVRHLMYNIPGYPKVDETNIVGNGGFSIRKRNIMHLAKKISEQSRFLDIGEAEDCYISRTIRNELEGVGVVFAPVALALGFSFENLPYSGQFGFHGKRTMEINGWI